MLKCAPAAALSLTVGIGVAHRPAPLALHLLWPVAAAPLQTVLFSHGANLSPPDYDPLLQAWASHGLAIVAPDHAGSAYCPPWLARAMDIHEAAEQLPAILARHALPLAPAAPVRLAGHSYGGHTVAILLGARPTLVASPDNLELPNADAGLLLAPPGNGGPDNLTPGWLERAPYLCLDLTAFRAASLSLAGGRDASPMSQRGWEWHTDMFFLSPAPSSPADARYLAVAPAGDHYLGGIATGRGAADRALFAEIAAVTAGYLLHGPAWTPPACPGHLRFTAHPGMHLPKGHQA
jgi:predicted dienelactone hydrolase